MEVVTITPAAPAPRSRTCVVRRRDTSREYKRIVATLDARRSFKTGNPNSSVVYGTISPFELARFGDSSEGYVASLTAPQVPVTITVDLAIVKKGQDVLEVFEANLEAVARQQFVAFLAKALARI